MLAAQVLLQGVSFYLIVEFSTRQVHGIRVLTVLNALKLTPKLERLAPRVQFQAPFRIWIAQKCRASFRARPTQQRLQRVAHDVFARVGICVH